jgi:hypothetical protein
VLLVWVSFGPFARSGAPSFAFIRPVFTLPSHQIGQSWGARVDGSGDRGDGAPRSASRTPRNPPGPADRQAGRVRARGHERTARGNLFVDCVYLVAGNRLPTARCSQSTAQSPPSRPPLPTAEATAVTVDDTVRTPRPAGRDRPPLCASGEQEPRRRTLTPCTKAARPPGFTGSWRAVPNWPAPGRYLQFVAGTSSHVPTR